MTDFTDEELAESVASEEPSPEVIEQALNFLNDPLYVDLFRYFHEMGARAGFDAARTITSLGPLAEIMGTKALSSIVKKAIDKDFNRIIQYGKDSIQKDRKSPASETGPTGSRNSLKLTR